MKTNERRIEALERASAESDVWYEPMTKEQIDHNCATIRNAFRELRNYSKAELDRIEAKQRDELTRFGFRHSKRGDKARAEMLTKAGMRRGD